MRALRDVVRAYRQRRAAVVVGTVVDVRGSAYRRPGARMVLQRGGERVGMISGGCLDKDVARHAWAWTEEGPRVALYDTRGDALHPQGRYGSGCDGVVEVLLERNVGPDGALEGADAQKIDPLAWIERAWTTRTRGALATLYRVGGSGAGEVGLRMARLGDAMVEERGWSPEVADAVRSRLEEASGWASARSLEGGTGAQAWSVLVEPLGPLPRLAVFGAGDDAQPLVAMAAELGWEVVVVDKWPALAQSARFPSASRVVCAPPEQAVAEAGLDAATYAVVMTHSFSDDLDLIPALLASPAPYVGLMGPRRRTGRLMTALLERGRLPAPEALDRLQAPVGIDLGAEAPEEVALSVLAGVMAARRRREGGLLKARPSGASIHPEHPRERFGPEAEARAEAGARPERV